MLGCYEGLVRNKWFYDVSFSATLAQKYWITNGAVHAKHVVVFAQLIVGGKNQVWNWKIKLSLQIQFLILFAKKNFALYIGSPRSVSADQGQQAEDPARRARGGHGLQDGAQRGRQRQAHLQQRQGAQGEPPQQVGYTIIPSFLDWIMEIVKILYIFELKHYVHYMDHI